MFSLQFHPLMSVFVIVLFFVGWVALCIFGFMRAYSVAREQADKSGRRAAIWSWTRRGTLGIVVLVMFLGPSLPLAEEEMTTNIEIFFAVDRTGSMAAEDWNEQGQRLEGVRQNIDALVDATAGSRYSVITWDSSSRLELPVTTDSSAVTSFAELLHQEISEFSSGSSINRPLQTITEALESAKESRPENARFLVIFSDGESTDYSDQYVNPLWAEVGGLIDGGAVFGYGTEDGGKMQIYESGTGQTGEYMTHPSDPDTPAISKIDQAKLQQLADYLDVPLEINPSDETVTALGDKLMKDAQQINDGRQLQSTYRYIIWPLGVVATLLLIWELAVFSAEFVKLRRTNAI